MDTFIARQPIFDRNKKVYGYELLFRSGIENFFNHSMLDQATSKVISDSFFLFGISSLTGGKRAFINVSEDFLLEEYLYLIPKEQIVIEILENVSVNSRVIQACEQLKNKGYLIALDDFVYEDSSHPLLRWTDFVKVDFLSTEPEKRKELIEKFSGRGIRFLAEKLETPLSFREAKILGYQYFQGYFFKKPDILTSKDISGFKLHYLHILQEIHRPELNFKQLEKIIKKEVSIAYKLLRYINSAYYGLPNKVSSILQALTLLGEKEVRKWCSLIALAHMGVDKPEELVMEAIVRARFCESMAPMANLPQQKDDLFLLGMFSLIDAILDRPISDILDEIPLEGKIKMALLGEENALRDVLETFLVYQKGNWEKLSKYCQKLCVKEQLISKLYWDSMKWAQDSFYSEFLVWR
jgi:EAL and modified HD-GYP domain-containing signal transduction protein